MAVSAAQSELRGSRDEIHSLAAAFFASNHPTKRFRPGVDPVPATGMLLGQDDLQGLIDASLDLVLSAGRFTNCFERRFARCVGCRSSLIVNSGPSASLLALTSLTSPRLEGRALVPGDEVVTIAAASPTTVNPIIQNGLTPVFVDIQIPTYNVDVRQLADAMSPRTRAIVLPHTLGNPFEAETVVRFCRDHDLWLVEDASDAIGASYAGENVGTFGAVAAASFDSSHQITTGEGGAVLVNDPELHRIVDSFRSWGRDCWCEPGKDDACRRRHDWCLGSLVDGYDHKFAYSHIGYDMKATEIQASLGVTQVEKLPLNVDARRRNHAYLRDGLADLQDLLILPEFTPGSNPSPYGFALAVRPDAPFSRRQLTRHIETHKIGAGLLFGGNLIRQPAYKDVPFRTVGALPNTDFAMENLFWLGVWPGLTPAHLDFVVDSIHDFTRTYG